ncbi:MAG: hypothetical protein IJE97_17205 [Thermoguttaceae bacterium]|nr:hypothetical protein [Thermoguttaceae bacterium]
MLKRVSLLVLGVAGALAFESTSAFAQDAPAARPAALSLDGIMGEEAAPAAPTFDKSVLEAPKDATPDELFEFVDTLQEKLPQPKSQEELYQIVDALSEAYLKIADQILAAKDLTPEQKERATQLKVVALTSRANVDPKAADALNQLVDETLKTAKTTDELVKAYQLKLQVIDASSDDPTAEIDALADEMLARAEEDLQVFAVEVKARSFLTATQTTGIVDPTVFEFADKIVADKKRAAVVVEKALEMKLVALVVAAELEKEKGEKADAKFAADAEKLFAQLLDGEYSDATKKTVYQLRLQTLLEANKQGDADATAKLENIVERLKKETDPELQNLAVSVKGQLLIDAAQKDEKAVDALDKFADETLALAQEKPELKTQAIGLKIQAFTVKKDVDGLLKFVDAQIADADAQLKSQLTRVKLSLIQQKISAEPEAFAQFEKFLEETAKDPAFGSAVSQLYAARVAAQLNALAEKGATQADFDKFVDDFKAEIEKRPESLTALLMGRAALDQIGEQLQKPELFVETFDAIVAYCKASKNETLQTLAENLEAYSAQMRQMEEQLKAEAATEAASETPADEEAQK